jgi:protocatechuate 3,4-dioxygenase alpha subunit
LIPTTTSQATTSQTTTSQTIGPFWHLLEDPRWSDLTRFGANVADIITVTGHVYDGGGAPVTDACVELWQSSPPADEHFSGFGRAATDAQGRFTFKTLMPAPEPGPGNSLQAPHLALTIFARGLLIHLASRVYFDGQPDNDNDPILALVPPERRSTLIATRQHDSWVLDIHLQGAHETVFFDI